MSDSEPAITRPPSRRRLFQIASAAGVPLPSLANAVDPGKVVAQRWCALEAEQRRLILQWQGIESWLFKHRNWPRLSAAERAAVPEGAQLAAIDEQLDAVDRAHDALLPILKATRATTREGVLARFDALLHLVIHDEHPDARALLKSCIADVKQLWR